MNREEWLAARQHTIGASEAAAAVGLSPWTTPLALWAEKVGEVEPADLEDNEAVQWGIRLEGVIAEWYSHETGRELQDLGRHTMQTRADLPHVHATLDRLILPCDGHDMPGVLEVKTAGARSESDWDDGPPLHYQVQLQIAMHVAGCEWGSFAVLMGGQRSSWCDVERHDGFMVDWLLPRLETFWGHVERREPPEATVDCEGVLRQLYPDDDGEAIPLPGEAVGLDDIITEHQTTIRDSEAQVNAAKNRLRQLLGTASIGVLPNGARWSNKANVRGTRTLRRLAD